MEAKSKNARYPHRGDIWTYTAIDKDSRLMVTWLVGDKDLSCATLFMKDLASGVP